MGLKDAKLQLSNSTMIIRYNSIYNIQYNKKVLFLHQIINLLFSSHIFTLLLLFATILQSFLFMVLVYHIAILFCHGKTKHFCKTFIHLTHYLLFINVYIVCITQSCFYTKVKLGYWLDR